MSLAIFLWLAYLYVKSNGADIGREGQSAELHRRMSPGSMLGESRNIEFYTSLLIFEPQMFLEC